jgi:hypothetical protein
MFKRKYLATNQEEVTVGDAAGTVAVIIVDAVELQSMFKDMLASKNVKQFNLICKCSSLVDNKNV